MKRFHHLCSSSGSGTRAGCVLVPAGGILGFVGMAPLVGADPHPVGASPPGCVDAPVGVSFGDVLIGVSWPNGMFPTGG